MRVPVYVRVSTPNQVQAQTIDQQLERVRQQISQQLGWDLRDEYIFRDDGYSGASLSRPGLDRLRDAAREREIDLVVVTAPDRFARNYVHQMVLLEELERLGCAGAFLDHPMSQDPHDHLLLQIRGAVAEYERTLITERMRRGRLAKLRAGVLLPWTRPPYGYRLHPDRPRDPAGVRVEPTEAAVVATIFATYLDPGVSLEQVAHRLHDQQVCSPTGSSGGACRRCAVSCAIPPIPDRSTPGVPAPVRRRFGAPPRIPLAAPMTAAPPSRLRNGLRWRRFPRWSVRSNSRWRRPNWPRTNPLPVATIPPTRICCARWSVVATANWRVRPAH